MSEQAPSRGPVERIMRRITYGCLIGTVALLATLPLFMLVAPYLPDLQAPRVAGWRVDHIAMILAILVGMVVVLRKFRPVTYGLLALALITLGTTSLLGRYSFGDLRHDYSRMLLALRERTVPLGMPANGAQPFTGAPEILASIDVQDRQVRSFAVRAATTWFTNAPVKDDEFTLVQCFSIFKVINSSWTYVSDPLGGEYFAKASESVDLLAGDCDDHAILMAACIKAVGGEARLVRTTGHIYPEMKVGDAAAMERAAYLIRKVLFPDVAKHAALFYHVDANGDRWINMDYTRQYPGGEVMNETIKGILPV